MPAVTPIGYAAEKQSIRESMMRKGLKSGIQTPEDTEYIATYTLEV